MSNEKSANVLTTKQAILAVPDQQIEKVYVEPWKSWVFIRVMSGHERDAFEMSITGGSDSTLNLSNFRARLAALCLCDEKGTPLFTEKDIRDLGKKSGKALNIVVAHAKKLNGITAEDQADIVKNLESNPESDSDSDSV